MDAAYIVATCVISSIFAIYGYRMGLKDGRAER